VWNFYSIMLADTHLAAALEETKRGDLAKTGCNQ
jgi:hypothetical protein